MINFINKLNAETQRRSGAERTPINFFFAPLHLCAFALNHLKNLYVNMFCNGKSNYLFSLQGFFRPSYCFFSASLRRRVSALNLLQYHPIKRCFANFSYCSFSVISVASVVNFCSLYADPWGKDADLVNHSCALPPTSTCQTPLMGGIAKCLIGFHQTVITPIDGPRSHFLPSSSQYTLDAMRKHGFLLGFTMGCDRLMRENEDPWVYEKVKDIHGYPMKYNPVR